MTNNPDRTVTSTPTIATWKRISLAALSATMLIGGVAAQIPAIAGPTAMSYQQESWRGVLNVARLVTANQLVMQLDVTNKPITRYANAVYMLYARRNGQWTHIYTSTGARLLHATADRVVLAPEVIDLKKLQQRLGWDLRREDVELKAVAQLRYDVEGYRDQQVSFEQVQQYSRIMATTTTQLVSYDATSLPTSVLDRPASEQGSFSLAILQKKSKLKNVIARISLKERQVNQFSAERFIGDFRYQLKQGKQFPARFTKGLKAGDRVVVRLFTLDNRFIGYSEFELLAYNTAVTLILPDRPEDYGIVRTVYGIDRDANLTLDRSVQIYDYFTQVTQVRDYRAAQVIFFDRVSNIDLSRFEVVNLPQPRSICSPPASFVTGSYTLVNRSFSAFSSSQSAVLTTLPGQLVQPISVSTSEVSTYQVSQLLVNYREVGVSQGTVQQPRADRKPNKKAPKRHCNQGIGNGSEGCDPGNSHPHGGSNDEGSR